MGIRQPRLAGLAGVLTMAMLAGCGAPRYRVEAGPEDAVLAQDGQLQRTRSIDDPIPYYGVVALEAIPSTVDATPTNTMLAIEHPVTPWIFPLDFFVEMARLPFVPDPVPTATISTTPRDDLPEVGFRATANDSLRAAAEAAAIER